MKKYMKYCTNSTNCKLNDLKCQTYSEVEFSLKSYCHVLKRRGDILSAMTIINASVLLFLGKAQKPVHNSYETKGFWETSILPWLTIVWDIDRGIETIDLLVPFIFLLISPILPEPELACLCPLGDASSDLNIKKNCILFSYL